MKKLRVTAVSYLNTKPLLYGLLAHPVRQQIDLSLDIPSECARKLQTGEADLGLIPVAALPMLGDYEIISDYCIGSTGAVKTVCLYGDRPLTEWTELYLDHHSRTSVALTRILCEQYWRVRPTYREAAPGYIDQIGGRTGGLVIGDRTIGLADRFAYVYDLGEAWHRFTGMPFVFAAWVSKVPLTAAFKRSFNTALRRGVASIDELTFLLPSPDPAFDLQEYFTHYISYDFDAAKQQALERFLQLAGRELTACSG